MRKTVKKMSLSRETIVTLTSPEIQGALGGYGTIETQCCDTWHQCTIPSTVPQKGR